MENVMHNEKTECIPAEKTGPSLFLLTDAAKYLGMSRNTFNRQCQDQIIPPPILTEPRRHWSAHQLDLYRRGMIKRNEHGIWYEWDADNEQQYITAIRVDGRMPVRAP